MAEERFASHAAKWNRTVNLPIASYGDVLTDASLPPKSLFAEISVRDEKGALRSVPKASMEGECLSVDNNEIWNGNIGDVLKRQTGKDRFGEDEFAAFIRADMECSHYYVASLIDVFTGCGIWNISILGCTSSESDDSRLVAFKILRPFPGIYPEEDRHIVEEEPLDEEDLSIHYVKPFSLGQRLTFWVGRRVDGSLDGAIVYCDKRVSLAELDGILAKLAADPETKGKTVAVRCAGDSPHKALVDVLDILCKHNFKRVYLLTI